MSSISIDNASSISNQLQVCALQKTELEESQGNDVESASVSPKIMYKQPPVVGYNPSSNPSSDAQRKAAAGSNLPSKPVVPLSPPKIASSSSSSSSSSLSKTKKKTYSNAPPVPNFTASYPTDGIMRQPVHTETTPNGCGFINGRAISPLVYTFGIHPHDQTKHDKNTLQQPQQLRNLIRSNSYTNGNVPLPPDYNWFYQQINAQQMNVQQLQQQQQQQSFQQQQLLLYQQRLQKQHMQQHQQQEQQQQLLRQLKKLDDVNLSRSLEANNQRNHTHALIVRALEKKRDEELNKLKGQRINNNTRKKRKYVRTEKHKSTQNILHLHSLSNFNQHNVEEKEEDEEEENDVQTFAKQDEDGNVMMKRTTDTRSALEMFILRGRKQFRAKFPNKDRNAVTSIMRKAWKSLMQEEDKRKYVEMATKEEEEAIKEYERKKLGTSNTTNVNDDKSVGW